MGLFVSAAVMKCVGAIMQKGTINGNALMLQSAVKASKFMALFVGIVEAADLITVPFASLAGPNAFFLFIGRQIGEGRKRFSFRPVPSLFSL
jgi:hypothetical protein